MSLVKSVYMPIRRYFFLDDEEKFHVEDLMWIIGLLSVTVITLVVCILATWSN